jgi:hypothetical protein
MGALHKLRILGELWEFMKVRKKWWLGPIILMLLLLGLLLVFTQGSALAPFIYTLFLTLKKSRDPGPCIVSAPLNRKKKLAHKNPFS